MDLSSPETAAPQFDLPVLSDSLVVASQPFVGRWNRLVSTTNWEKGRIISQWREALISQGLPVAEYSDEAWCRLVGGVTGQHVGRLRRVFQRFGPLHEQFKGLFWSHFQAALDWDDAEMWLEGAKTSGWSVNEMRTTRWETLGKLETERPQPNDIITSETDEDFEPASRERTIPDSITGEYGEISSPRHDGPDFGDEPSPQVGNSLDGSTAVSSEPVELVRPFENLPQLPDDLGEAFEAMKLAILRHKTAEWRDISAGDVLCTLDALKALVVAPSAEAPF